MKKPLLSAAESHELACRVSALGAKQVLELLRELQNQALDHESKTKLNTTKINQIIPSKELYNKVKAGFIIKGTTLGVWCRESGVKQSNVISCLVGSWDGPKAKILRSKLIMESGVTL
ncbi:hypothetical protein [Vibrio crassostreae]|uniref:hypothetical protein n=1 Tax=Vibrio crassostreae TaxID=246167 RepID=UPI002E18A5DD|nr:hypothetical protein [Vibrio crassostreae]